MTSNTSSPLVLLVPGAWHTPRCFDLIILHFNQRGYDTRAIQLPSVGTTPGLPDMSADIALVRENVDQILDEGNRDAILFMHSYGAGPSTEAVKGLGKEQRTADGKNTGVVALFYIAAVLPVVGESPSTASADVTDEEKANPGAWTLKDNGDGTVEVEDPILCFYSDAEPELAQEAVKWLRPHSFGSFLTQLTYAASQDIPAAYLLCKNDKMLPYIKQQRIVRESGIEITETIESAHSPFLTQPQAVVEFVQRTLAKMLSP